MPQQFRPQLGIQLPPTGPDATSSLPKEIIPRRQQDDVADFLAGLVGARGIGPTDSRASTYGMGAGALLPLIGGIFKALKPDQAIPLVDSLKSLANNLAPSTIRQSLENWGHSGAAAIPASTAAERLAKALAAHPEWRDQIEQRLAQGLPTDKVTVYRGMAPPHQYGQAIDRASREDPMSWIKPIPGPTSFTLSPKVAKQFGGAIVGLEAPRSAILGTPPNYSEQEMVVNMTPELWEQTKVLRTPAKSTERWNAKNAQNQKNYAQIQGQTGSPPDWAETQGKYMDSQSYAESLKQTGKPSPFIGQGYQSIGPGLPNKTAPPQYPHVVESEKPGWHNFFATSEDAQAYVNSHPGAKYLGPQIGKPASAKPEIYEVQNHSDGTTVGVYKTIGQAQDIAHENPAYKVVAHPNKMDPYYWPADSIGPPSAKPVNWSDPQANLHAWEMDELHPDGPDYQWDDEPGASPQLRAPF